MAFWDRTSKMARTALRAHEDGRAEITIGRASDFYGPHVTVSAVGERVFAIRQRNVAQRGRDYTTSVQESATPASADPYEQSDIEYLPAPVRRYFETVLREGQQHVSQVRLRQAGQFRLGGTDAS
jgi:hypothetical protein